jgi:hypothetical protein
MVLNIRRKGPAKFPEFVRGVGDKGHCQLLRALSTNRPEFAGANICFDPFDNAHPAASWREVALHLPVPLVHFLLVEPSGESRFFIGRQLGNRLLEGLQRHTSTVDC